MPDLLDELRMQDRDEAVAFLKGLIAEDPQPCPLCGGKIDYLHKKAKKSNCRWKCASCGRVYRVADILKRLPEH